MRPTPRLGPIVRWPRARSHHRPSSTAWSASCSTSGSTHSAITSVRRSQAGVAAHSLSLSPASRRNVAAHLGRERPAGDAGSGARGQSVPHRLRAYRRATEMQRPRCAQGGEDGRAGAGRRVAARTTRRADGVALLRTGHDAQAVVPTDIAHSCTPAFFHVGLRRSASRVRVADCSNSASG